MYSEKLTYLIIAIDKLLTEMRYVAAGSKDREPDSGECEVRVDPEELQLLDESNSEWVEAWKKAVRQRAEPEVRVIETCVENTEM
jgi:hypothetical protein